MSTLVPPNGLARVILNSGDRIATYSREPIKVWRIVGSPNLVDDLELLSAVPADTEFRSAAFAGNGATIVIEAGEAEALYAVGVTAVITENIGRRAQPTPTAMTVTANITPAGLLSGLIIGTHAAGATQTYTLPTGALLDAAVTMGIDESVDWALINASAAAADTITLAAAASGHTIVGAVVVVSADSAPANTAMYRTRKTAADTFITYRIG
jgi:hypothetical protein